MVIGGWLVILIAHLRDVIDDRLNYGKRLYHNRRQIGRLVSVRFGGSKSYMFVDEYGQLNMKCFHNKKQAIAACKQTFEANRPKQTLFPKVA